MRASETGRQFADRRKYGNAVGNDSESVQNVS